MAAPTFGADEVNAAVIDIGAYECKAGYAGEDMPKAVFRTTVGEIPEEHRAAVPMDEDRPSTSKENNGAQPGNSSASRGAKRPWQQRGLSVLKAAHTRPLDYQEVRPTIQDGNVADWDAWECVIHEAVNERLRFNCQDQPVLLSESAAVSKDNREKVTEHMFETFLAPALFLSKSAVLSSFALGRQTSLVLDIGYEGTIAAAVHDGYVLNQSIVRSPVGGHVLDECLIASLKAKEIDLHPWYLYSKSSKAPGGQSSIQDAGNITKSYMSWSREFLAADMKVSHCRMNEQPFVEEDNLNMPMQTYELPDGSQIDVGVERFKIPEILFNPALIKTIPSMRSVSGKGGHPPTGVAEMVIESVNNTDVDVRKELFGGVILTGGSSLFQSTKERLDRELLEIAPQAAKVKVAVHPSAMERKFAAWLGGSILGCLGSFHQMWMSKQEYEEHGAALIHRKSP